MKRSELISMKHGAGGRAMRDLIERVFIAGAVAQPGVVGLAEMDDGAAIPFGDGYLVVTTDSHVVQPRFFPGGDIGRLAICGTVNDLAMMGATEPLALTCGAILEEGFPVEELERIQRSMRAACDEAGASILTGDTKVMGRGEVDGIVLNTTGVAFTKTLVRDCALQPDDRIIVTGPIADHGFAVLVTRNDLKLSGDLRSDVAPLNSLVRLLLRRGGVTAMKDPTRGGVSSALHEMAGKSKVGVVLEERDIPLRDEVRAAAELLGIDPLHVANEGKALLGVRPDAVDAVLDALRSHPLGREAAVIGRCTATHPGRIKLRTGVGERLLQEPDGEPLPRIC